jgi:hypothetical protein
MPANDAQFAGVGHYPQEPEDGRGQTLRRVNERSGVQREDPMSTQFERRTGPKSRRPSRDASLKGHANAARPDSRRFMPFPARGSRYPRRCE